MSGGGVGLFDELAVGESEGKREGMEKKAMLLPSGGGYIPLEQQPPQQLMTLHQSPHLQQQQPHMWTGFPYAPPPLLASIHSWANQPKARAAPPWASHTSCPGSSGRWPRGSASRRGLSGLPYTMGCPSPSGSTQLIGTGGQQTAGNSLGGTGKVSLHVFMY
uniref:Uncharacterized protein n=1 Tax=Chromera velia CCMP2878 TaxID=1169474 RepID=A0A0G4GCS3_9ALVE|eukprot:Cvel_4529.t1-p1 / transcript=Cvel_4529.t1 / gene=Cvel_4529 / organism=Chromera_velia_CCMP2878 / gene_product=hypothetical protein / transcript_product=hypothetical protein / location=Cvel_scaffold198:73669-74151(-) / protein_length=161 / sequence_SO=supercontig / SO=protein_coding / is_pseudo=false